MVNEDATRVWTNGYILLGKNTRIEVEEVSVDLSRDLKEHYNSGSSNPSTLVSGTEKIDIKIKRVYSDTTLAKIYQKKCSFPMILFNNTPDTSANATGDQVCMLEGCMLSKFSLGTLGNGDAVTESVDGKALSITFEDKKIAQVVNQVCDAL